MAATSNLRLAAALILGLGPSASLVAACSGGNSNPTPTAVVYNLEDSGSDATSSEGGGPDGTSTTVSPDGSSPAPDAGFEDAANDAQPPACTPVLADSGCWVCPAQTPTSVEFLNQCAGTGVSCSPYNNFANIPGYDGGPLVWTN